MDLEGPDSPTPTDGDADADATSEPAPPRGVTRRKVLRYGLAGAAGLAGTGAVASLFFGPDRASWSSAPSAEVFKGDAPTGETWAQWRQRGWAREASHYRRLRDRVRCRLCPNNCLLDPGDRGRCRNRVNVDGTLYTMVYGNPCSLNNDPIEKKPLYHFLPRTGVVSIATSGCGFRCLNCQNWEISQRKPEETKDPTGPEVLGTPERLRAGLTRGDLKRLSLFPEHVVALAESVQSPSIAYTYSEPTCFYEYMLDTARLARQRGLKNVWVTCGYIHREPLEEFCEVLDAANVDLKSFDEQTYEKLNSGKLQPILDTLKTLKNRGVWFEVTHLVVPTYTDKMDMIRRMCGWLVENLGPDVPLHFSKFHPRHKLAQLPETPAATLIEARDIARKAGLRYVYVGNVLVADGGTTFCPKCGRPVLVRRGYQILLNDVQAGRCRHCRTPIAGVWA